EGRRAGDAGGRGIRVRPLPPPPVDEELSRDPDRRAVTAAATRDERRPCRPASAAQDPRHPGAAGRRRRADDFDQPPFPRRAERREPRPADRAVRHPRARRRVRDHHGGHRPVDRLRRRARGRAAAVAARLPGRHVGRRDAARPAGDPRVGDRHGRGDMAGRDRVPRAGAARDSGPPRPVLRRVLCGHPVGSVRDALHPRPGQPGEPVDRDRPDDVQLVRQREARARAALVRDDVGADRPRPRAPGHAAQAPAVRRDALRAAPVPGHRAGHHAGPDAGVRHRLRRAALPVDRHAVLGPVPVHDVDLRGQLELVQDEPVHRPADEARRDQLGGGADAVPDHAGAGGRGRGLPEPHGVRPVPAGAGAKRAGGAVQRHQHRPDGDPRVRDLLAAGRDRRDAVHLRGQQRPAVRVRQLLRALRDRRRRARRVQPARRRGLDHRRRDRGGGDDRVAQLDQPAGHPDAARVRDHRRGDPRRRGRRRARQARRRQAPGGPAGGV
ncbi:MAG: Ribose ABC transport system, permease protein RbsC, partial [uncultured Phycisphaerae bacterium]